MSTPGPHPLAPREAGWYPDPAGTGGQRWHDGVGWTATVTHSGTSAAIVLGKPFARMADWLGRMLGLWGIVYLLCAAVPAWFWMKPPHVDLAAQTTTTPGVGATEHVEGAAAFVWASVGLGALSLVTVVTWLVWQYRLAVSSPVPTHRSPAAHVWWWFVPFASYWIPRGNIGDLWHAYGTQTRGQQAEPTPAVFSVWWALWLAPLLMYPLFILVVFRADTVDAAVRDLMAFWTLSLVAGSLSAFTARLVVRDMSWRALLYWSDAR